MPKYVNVTKELPEMPLDLSSNYCDENIHVYAHPEKDKRSLPNGKVYVR